MSAAASAAPWGVLMPLVLDTSAWSRLHHDQIAGHWAQAVRQDRVRISPPVRLEILLIAQGGDSFDKLADRLAALRPAPLSSGVARAAEHAMRTLAHRSSGAHRIPVVDYLVAASAQEIGAAVLHYDHDYDTLAEVMAFESVWLAPPGSLP